MPVSLAERYPGIVPPRYLLEPEQSGTFGPEVAELAELANYAPDPEQRLGLDIMFGFDRHGKCSAASVCVICGRQNIKTGLLKQAGLGWFFITEERSVVWSAHLDKTVRDAHRDMVEIIMSSDFLKRRVLHVYNSAADRSIHLKTGARMIFITRTQGSGRGLAGNKTILDEGLYVAEGEIDALVPALSAMPDPQVAWASSAGLAQSNPLRRLRNRGRSGRGGRLGYMEFCSERGGCQQDACDHAVDTPGCALDDMEKLREANPSLGRVRANGTGLTLQWIREERQTLSPAGFARERHGWWEESGADEVFGPGRWDACSGPTPSGVNLEVVGVAVDGDLAHAAIVGGGQVGERVYVQVLAHGPGLDWVAALLPAGVKVLVDGTGPAAVLLPHLQQLRSRLHVLTGAQNRDAFAAMFSVVKGETLLHDSDPLLTASLNGAVVGDVGDRMAWRRRKSTSDVSAIEAATLAAWWVSLPARPASDPRPAPAVERVTTPRNDLQTVGF